MKIFPSGKIKDLFYSAVEELKVKCNDDHHNAF